MQKVYRLTSAKLFGVCLRILGERTVAEAVLASIPPQLDRPTLSYREAAAELGVFSNPIAALLNGAGAVILLVGFIYSRIRGGRRTR